MASNECALRRNRRRPSIAIVTVCLNDLPGLRATCESVRSQTEPPCQWIVADGASNDGSQLWLDTLDWPLLRWSSVRDGGIYQGMNRALREVDADYVLFLNSGDLLCDPEVLKSVSAFLATCPSPPSLLYGDSYEVDMRGKDYLRRARPAWWIWLGMPTTHQAMFFRRDALGAGFDVRYRLSADYAAVCNFYRVSNGADCRHFSRPICYFFLGGRTDQLRNESLREMLTIRRDVLGMASTPALLLHAAHHVQRWVKANIPFLHRLIRYG